MVRMKNSVGEVHGKSALCDDFGCTPAAEEESAPMMFEITTSYRSGDEWGYRMDWQRPGGTSTKQQFGYASRNAAKRAAEAYADGVAKASVKPETYTYEGKVS